MPNKKRNKTGRGNNDHNFKCLQTNYSWNSLCLQQHEKEKLNRNKQKIITKKS